MDFGDGDPTDRALLLAPQLAPHVLQKLEWPLLIDVLAGHCQTDDGRDRALNLVPRLIAAATRARWELVEPLKILATQSYKAPIGALPPLGTTFRAASLGQMLDGSALRAVSVLLESTRNVFSFAAGLESRCSTLRKFKSRILTSPHLQQAINRAIGPDGELLDDASPELSRIRRQKVSLRRRIEELLIKLMHADQETMAYLQDDFFTVRADRYVVPIKVDGRGRVSGQVLDTSASGQTLFIEPAPVAPLNQQLLELEIEEKLEIARIFRELSAKVELEVPLLRANYAELIELDCLTAEAQLAADLAAGPVELSMAPVLDLCDARHPLLALKTHSGGPTAVANDVGLGADQSLLIISGPNAGGKTVVLKTVGLLHLMAKAGLLIPADASSKLYLYDHIYLEMGDAQNLNANLSTFSGHLTGLKPILEKADARDLVLLDELAVGTDPQTGAAIGTAILEDLGARHVSALVTTHFDALKSLAISDHRFRNGSMEFSLGSLKPTYRLILDIPGQSYGLEVAEQIGLPARVLTRAKELRHGTMSSLDHAVNQLMAARDEARGASAEAQREKLLAETERVRWQQETELLKAARQKTSQQLADRYESRLQDMRAEYDELVKKLKQVAKDTQVSSGEATSREVLLDGRKAAGTALRNMEGVVNELRSGYDAEAKLPGQPVTREALLPDTPVYVLPLKKAGKVLRLGSGTDATVEVEVGVIKLRVSLHDLRLLSRGEAPPANGGSGQPKKTSKPARSSAGTPQPSAQGPGAMSTAIGLTLQTPTNSVDLRGRDVDSALEATWNFIDRAMMRGEDATILIHGHGEGTLKAALRDALKYNCPYDVSFRPGSEQEGGDGVTIVQLKN